MRGDDGGDDNDGGCLNYRLKRDLVALLKTLMQYSLNSQKASRNQHTRIMKNLNTTKALVSICLVATVLFGCSGTEQDAVKTEVDEQPIKVDPTNGNVEIWPELDIKVKKDAKIEQRVSDILATLTLEQKVAQLIQPEIRDFTVEDMRTYGFGSYLNGGGAFPNNDKHASVDDWVALAEAMHAASVDDSLDGTSIPTMWGTDAVHGHNNVIGATIFPHNIGLGAANNPALIEQIAKATATEVMATGIDWVFAPTVAVVRNDRWGRTYEGYSEDPQIVHDYAESIVRGLQGAADQDFLSETHVISTVKHFVGDGGTEHGIDQGNNLASEQDLFDVHAQGYVGGLTEGAQSVMASFNSWHGKKMHGNRYLLTDVLKDRMGFDGFVVGDWLGHGQVAGCTNESCSQAINAGLDIFMASGDSWKPLYANTIEQVKSGEIPMARIDDAVSRVLRVKLRAGLFEKNSPANRPLAGNASLVGHADHRAVAQQAVRESLVLLKNDAGLLPLDPTLNVLVAGDAANNIGKQSGGWTITWQGTRNENSDFPGGTSIFDGIKATTEAAGGSATLAVEGEYSEKPDVAIVVFGEEPYAEGQGDTETLEYQFGSKTDLALLKKLHDAGVPTVAIFISGRPLWVNPELNASDAFVAAWLPGSEGKAVSDLLFRKADGSVNADFKGKLSFSWPLRPDQYLLNKGDADYSPLFAYGYGLDYSSEAAVGYELPTNFDDLQPATKGQVEILSRKPNPSLNEYVSDSAGQTLVAANSMSNAAINYRTVDKEVQEDARRIEFAGDGSYGFTADQPLDISEIVEQGSMQISINLLERPTTSVIVRIGCGEGCSVERDVTAPIKALPLDQWQRISIPLACFGLDAEQMQQISAPFELVSGAGLTLEVAEIALKNTSSNLSCD